MLQDPFTARIASPGILHGTSLAHNPAPTYVIGPRPAGAPRSFHKVAASKVPSRIRGSVAFLLSRSEGCASILKDENVGTQGLNPEAIRRNLPTKMRLSCYCFFLASWQIDRGSSDASNQGIWSFTVQSRTSPREPAVRCGRSCRTNRTGDRDVWRPMARMGLFPIAYNDPRYG
jgi:hypothetical protein